MNFNKVNKYPFYDQMDSCSGRFLPLVGMTIPRKNKKRQQRR